MLKVPTVCLRVSAAGLQSYKLFPCPPLGVLKEEHQLGEGTSRREGLLPQPGPPETYEEEEEEGVPESLRGRLRHGGSGGSALQMPLRNCFVLLLNITLVICFCRMIKWRTPKLTAGTSEEVRHFFSYLPSRTQRDRGGAVERS